MRNPVGGAIQVAALAAATAVLLAGCTAAPAGHPVAAGSGAHSAPASAIPTAARPVAPPPVTLPGYYAQTLRWQSCAQVFQCARLLVPFDYSRPSWRRFSLPVIRLAATDPAQRIGSLVINPGGPGVSGVGYALQARSVVSAAVRARFDVVGFDPRGVGGSVPAVHCLTGPQLDKYFETDDTPAGSAQLATVVSESKDVLRAALGEAKLSYLGKSYGTYLGTWYAQLFPSHVRALVLDGALDPGASAFSMNIVQGEGFEVALRSFAADCMTRAGCPLGNAGLSAGIARLQALITEATSHPLHSNLGDGRPANGALLLNGIASSLYSKTYWPTLRSALRAAFAGDGTLLIQLGDLLFERSSSGTYTNLADANMAVNCLDRPTPRGLAAWSSAASAAAKAAPQFGAAIMWGTLPCAYWPVSSPALPAIKAAGAPPILVVGNKRDPATPYRWAVALAGDLASGVLLGWNGDGHTAYLMGSPCVDGIVNRYLLTLAVPHSGTLCPQ